MRRFHVFLLIFCMLTTLAANLNGCGSAVRSVTDSGFFFDTIITVTLYGTDERAYIDECFSLARRYENLLSNTVEGSDVWEINAHAGSYTEVAPETAELIRTGIHYGQLSGGRFDITLGKLSDLWNFPEVAENLGNEDNVADASALPSDAEIQALLPHIDYRGLLVEGDRVCLKDTQARLDLGGIAKGYIADRMKEYLTSVSVTSGIINLGGNVLTLGEKTDHTPYRIGIQKPFSDRGELLGTIELSDRTAVTSGVYERYFRVDGRLYHHILDLTTGYPYDNGLYSVTIICRDSVDGDALSTTCFALGLEEGMKLIESIPDTEAIFVDSSLKTHCSSGIGDSLTII